LWVIVTGKWSREVLIIGGEIEQVNSIPEYQPGDKIYKLFKHNKVIVNGKNEVFIIKIKKLKIE